MLDEATEYRLYTSRSYDCELFSYDQLRNNFAGLYRIMTLVARGFISGYMNDVARDRKGLARIERCTVRCLKAWCGMCEYRSQKVYYGLLEEETEKVKWRRIYDEQEAAKRLFSVLGGSCLGTLLIELPENGSLEDTREQFRSSHPIIYEDYVCEDCDRCASTKEGKKRFEHNNNLRGWFPEYALRMIISPLLPLCKREFVKAADGEIIPFPEPTATTPDGKKVYSPSERVDLLAAKCGYKPLFSTGADLTVALSEKSFEKLDTALKRLSELSRGKKRSFREPELDRKYDVGSDINRITYSRVIAAALDLGELQRYRLRCSLPHGTAGAFTLVRDKNLKYLYDISDRNEANALRQELIEKLEGIINSLGKSNHKTVIPLLNSVQRYFRDSGIDDDEKSASVGGRPRVRGTSLADLLDKALNRSSKLSGVLGDNTEILRHMMERTDAVFLRSYPPEFAGITDEDGQPLKRSDQQIVLKALGCFLKERGQRDARTVTFTTSELLIWTQVSDKTAALERFRIRSGEKTEPLLFITYYAGSMKKLSVNEKWLDAFDWRLATDGESSCEDKKNAVVEYSDNGISANMTRATIM